MMVAKISALRRKCGDLCEGGIGPASDSGASQQIYRVPDAVVPDKAVQQRRHDHRGAACDATLYPSHHRGRVHRQARAMAFVDLNTGDLGSHGGVFELLHSDRHSNVVRMRPHLTEPSHAAGNDKHRPQNAYPRVRHQPCEGKRQTQGQHHRKRGRGRQLHHFIGYAVVFLLVFHCFYLFLSAANDVDHGKNHHPDPVDKVPIEREHLELSRVLAFQLPREGKNQHDR